MKHIVIFRFLRFLIIFFSFSTLLADEGNITPYKFSFDEKGPLPTYTPPSSCTFSVARPQKDAPAITFYFSKPSNKSYPIAFFCTGSSSKESLYSIIHMHRFFLKEFLELGVGLVTCEQWGMDAATIDADMFMRHYTRTQRLQDHRNVIEYLQKHPPQGWNGKLIFVGVSEGGPLVTALTIAYADQTLATVNWSGADGWAWRDELWAFIDGMHLFESLPWHIRLRARLPQWFPGSLKKEFPRTRRDYDALMDKTCKNPTFEKFFMGMTYAYHTDALQWPATEYQQIRSPYLVVAGDLDTAIRSEDAFVEYAKQAGVNITYMRLKNVGHQVARLPEVIEQSFVWLKGVLESTPVK